MEDEDRGENQLKNELAAYLRTIVWDHAVTGTFKFPCTADVALERFDHFANGLCRITGGPVHHFVVAEPTHVDRYHVHALVQGTWELPVQMLAKRWRRRNGRWVKVTRYRPGGGWEAYCTKSISPEFDEYRFSQRFHEAERR